MKDKTQHFVCTTDEKTAQKLRELGFPELKKDGNRWVFINQISNEIAFSKDDMQLAYTNKLTL